MDEYDNNKSKSAHDGGPKSGDKETENTSLNEAGLDLGAGGKVRVAVHEDFLFDVDIERRELSPVYWLGAIFEVRRGR